MDHPVQVTVRGLRPELARKIRKMAAEEGISLNKVALRLLEKGAGIQHQDEQDRIGHDLDHLMGTWSQEKAEEFEAAIESLSRIDEELWK